MHLEYDAGRKFVFRCKHEVLPEPDLEVDRVFGYARWLQVNNQLRQDPQVDLEIERLYRVAAENGHAKANINLQNGSVQKRYGLQDEEALRLSHKLIEAGVATGYFMIAIYLRDGLSGLQKDQEMALRYFRKAADEGSADAQYYLGLKHEPSEAAPEVAMEMYLCAAQQGRGDAAVALGMYRKRYGRYEEAFQAFQLGVAAGNASSASFLGNAFQAQGPEDELFYLGLVEDVERAERYLKVWRMLANYSYARPRVPEIDEIIPPPPSILPPWGGKIKWLAEQEVSSPPPRPSETQIKMLAEEQNLEPATGRPTPVSTAFVPCESPATVYVSGDVCSRSVCWQAVRLVDGYLELKHGRISLFERGEVMPLLKFDKRSYKKYFAGGAIEEERNVEW